MEREATSTGKPRVLLLRSTRGCGSLAKATHSNVHLSSFVGLQPHCKTLQLAHGPSRLAHEQVHEHGDVSNYSLKLLVHLEEFTPCGITCADPREKPACRQGIATEQQSFETVTCYWLTFAISALCAALLTG